MAYSKKEKEKILNEVFERMAEGESLRSVLRSDNMPHANTFYEWIDDDEEKSEQYARAIELRTDYYADEILQISDAHNADVTVSEDGSVQINGQVIQRSKLQVDTRKWLMGKLNAPKYGDKSTTVLEGGSKPIQIDFTD